MKIGCFSDTHLREAVPGTSPVRQRESRRMKEAIGKALEFFIKSKVNLLIIPGDVIDDPGHPAAKEDLKAVKDMVSRLKIPVIAIAGNHDPGPGIFFEIFKRPEKSIIAGGCELIPFCDETCGENELTCERAGASLDEMRRALSSNPPGVKHTIMIQHYVIFPDRNEGYPHNYSNDTAIRQVMEGSPRRIFSVSGHYHPGSGAAKHNGVVYFCAGAMCEDPFPCYIFDTDGDEITVIEERSGGSTADKARRP